MTVAVTANCPTRVADTPRLLVSDPTQPLAAHGRPEVSEMRYCSGSHATWNVGYERSLGNVQTKRAPRPTPSLSARSVPP